MTKRILCLILSLCILFLFAGCNNEVEEIETVRRTYKITTDEYDNTPDISSMACLDYGYIWFDDCLSKTTDIVKATFLGTVKLNDVYYFNFEIQDILKGNFDDSVVSVYVNPADYVALIGDGPVSSYTTENIDYEVNKNYLLLLSRNVNVHYDGDLLSPIHDTLVILLGSDGTPDISASKMYNTNFEIHIRDSGLKQDILNGNLINRVLEITKDNPEVHISKDIIDTDDPVEILEKSEIVLIVTVDNKMVSSYDPPYDRAFCDCSVVKVIKGDIEEKTLERLILTNSKVNSGEVYLLALNKPGNYYRLSSRNSIFPWEIEE